VDEFLRRVAAREGTDLDTALRHARAVFAALGRTVSEQEIADMTAELPKDFEPLIAEAERRFVPVLPAEAFLERVADRAGLTAADAPRATDAVLETLAERISGGEIDDIISCAAWPSARASRPSWREHTAAVFETLREAIGNEEFLDITAQLPREYQAVGARPQRP
jgi:uncharacterized protein (DUF2267 family)